MRRAWRTPALVFVALASACTATDDLHRVAVHAGAYAPDDEPAIIVESEQPLDVAEAEAFLNRVILDTDGDLVGDVSMWDVFPHPVHLTPWSPAEFAAWEAHRDEMRRRFSWRWPDHTEVLRVPPDGDRDGH